MILVERLTKRFNGVPAVSGLSFEVPTGCVCGFLGPNGAGKTTTIRALAGALAVDEGRMVLCGADLATDPAGARVCTGYLPDNAPMPGELRVCEYLQFRCALWGVPAANRKREIREAEERCAISDIRRRLVGTLSRGMRQRVGLAGVLVTSPRVVILDEPTTGLDPTAALGFRELVRGLRGEHTVLFSSHNLAEVEVTCDHLVLIDRGRLIAQGSTSAVVRSGAASPRIEIESTRTDVDGIRALRGVSAVRSVSLDPQWVRTEVEMTPGCAADDGISSDIGRLLAESGAVVRKLQRRMPSLEEVFARLVGGR